MTNILFEAMNIIRVHQYQQTVNSTLQHHSNIATMIHQQDVTQRSLSKKKREKTNKKTKLAKLKTRKGGLGKNERPGGLKTRKGGPGKN